MPDAPPLPPPIIEERDDMVMLEPGKFGSAVQFKKLYGIFIYGEWVAPA